MTRPSRIGWLLGIAQAVGDIADCTRRRVGAVIFDPETFYILSAGYNGRASGLPGCLTEGACPRGQSDVPSRSSYAAGSSGSCDAIHAEDNTLRQARSRGVNVEGMHIAVTAEPCEPCYVLCRHWGIARVIWPDGHRDLSAVPARNET